MNELCLHKNDHIPGKLSNHLTAPCLLLFLFILLACSCSKKEESINKAPTCLITSPVDGFEIEQGVPLTISVDANDEDGRITEIHYYIDSSEIAFSNSVKYTCEWNTSSQSAGKHTVKVTVKDNKGSSISDEKTIYISTGGNNGTEIIAAFCTTKTSISPGSFVKFTDQSTNSPVSWFWNFGDGSTSDTQNPLHQYSAAGIYTIMLITANSAGSDTLTKNDFITVAAGGSETGTVSDYDGNKYTIIKIGLQWWMSENLKTTHFADGTEIPRIENNAEWDNLDITDKAYCYYENSPASGGTYGALYTWSAAMNGAGSTDGNPSYVQGACPEGWHLPSDSEWIELEMFLGMTWAEAFALGWRGEDEGNMLKTTSGWDMNGNGTNSSGFTALPGGYRVDNLFTDLGKTTAYWSTTEYINNHSYAFNRSLSYLHSGIGWFSASHFYGHPKYFGLAVRCLKD